MLLSFTLKLLFLNEPIFVVSALGKRYVSSVKFYNIEHRMDLTQYLQDLSNTVTLSDFWRPVSAAETKTWVFVTLVEQN